MKLSRSVANAPGSIALALVIAAALCFGCGSDGSDDDGPANSAESTPTEAGETATREASAGDPVGLIALGHSGMNAQNSNPAMRGYGAPQNSWSTGTVPEVNSVYQRMIAIRPETEGHVFNAAEGGSNVEVLDTQAEFALRAVPAPELVIIGTIDNDIRCDGTDTDERIGTFGQHLADALDVIVEASPRSRVLVVSFLGRPAQAATVFAGDEFWRKEFSGTEMCNWFNPAGELVEANVAAETAIIERYEAEQKRVCETVPQCSTDGGILATYQEDLSRIIPGDGHLNIVGQAAVAELIWPTVQPLLQAP